MRKFGRGVCLFVIAGILISLLGCNNSSGNGDKNSTGEKTNSQTATGKDGKVDLKGTTIVEFSPGEPWDGFKDAIAAFERETGAKVQIKIYPPDVQEKMYLTTIAAGKGPDIISVHAGNFPRVAVRNLAVPLNDYIDLNDPIFDKSVSDIYTWKGKVYSVNYSIMPTYILYNKTMFDDAGLKTPLEYYQEGNWNFDTFKEVAKQLTDDTDKNGDIDQYGYAAWQYELFTLANGGKLVDYKDDGGMNLALNYPETLEALNFMQDGYFVSKFIHPDGNNKWKQDFIQGKVAMIAEGLEALGSIAEKGELKFEFGLAPFPKGPSNKSGVYPGNMHGFGIANNAANPHGAAQFLKFRYEYLKNLEEENLRNKGSVFSDDEIAMTNEIKTKKVVNAKIYGIGNWWNIQWPFWTDIFNGIPVATAINTYTPRFEREINLMLSQKQVGKADPFSPVPTIEFEDGKIPDVLTLDKCEPTEENAAGEVKVTTDTKEVISGAGSLKLEFNQKAEWARFIRTDEQKLNLPAMRNYKIKFDYKVTADCADDGIFYIMIRPVEYVIDGSYGFGFTTLPGKYEGDEGTFETEIMIDDVTPLNSLVIGGKNAGTLIIDNLSITEVKID